MTSAVDDLDWAVLLQSLEQRSCVALLGPYLHSVNGTASARLVTELSNELVGMLDESDRKKIGDPDDLPLVAQVFVDSKSRPMLEIVVRSFYDKHSASLSNGGGKDPMFEALATLPFRLFVCSRQDATLEHFLEAQGKRPIPKAYNFKGDQELSVGRCDSDNEPVIYRLLGSPSEPRSLALTQRDRFDLIQAIVTGNPGLPTDLRNHLKQKCFLFLGCGLRDYYLKMLLHVLELNTSGQPSYGLEATDEESVWFYKVEYRTLKLLEVEATEFVLELSKRWSEYTASNEKPPPPTFPKERPRVFISYVREDESTMEQIRHRLENDGIEAWVDTEMIRGGANWEHELEDAIDNDVDFFAVLIGRNFNDHVRTYAHLEVKRAVRRRAQLPALRFIFPLQIDDEDMRLDVLDREKIQTTRLSDFDAGVADLARDIKREYAKLKRR